MSSTLTFDEKVKVSILDEEVVLTSLTFENERIPNINIRNPILSIIFVTIISFFAKLATTTG